MAIETVPFDAAPFFETPESQAELLAEAFESGEVGFILVALDTVARAKGAAAVAAEARLLRQSLDKASGGGGDPSLSTLVEVARALGFRLTVEPVAAE